MSLLLYISALQAVEGAGQREESSVYQQRARFLKNVPPPLNLKNENPASVLLVSSNNSTVITMNVLVVLFYPYWYFLKFMV